MINIKALTPNFKEFKITPLRKNNLNILKYGYLPWKPCNFIENFNQFFSNIKYAYQRVTRGYAACDTWNLDWYYTELIIETLNYFKNNLNSFPTNLTVENWQLILGYLIDGFTKIQEYQNNDNYNFEMTAQDLIEQDNYYRSYRAGLLWFLGLIYDDLWD